MTYVRKIETIVNIAKIL